MISGTPLRASVPVGGLGLPIIGRLLGHAHAATLTICSPRQRSAAASPETIAGRIAAAPEGSQKLLGCRCAVSAKRMAEWRDLNRGSGLLHCKSLH